MALDDYLKGEILDAYFLAGPLELALFDEDDVEVTGGSYARQEVTFTLSAGPGDIENDAAVTFPSMPAVDVAGGRLYDSSGNPYTDIQPLPSPVPITAGQPAEFAAGAITFVIT